MSRNKYSVKLLPHYSMESHTVNRYFDLYDLKVTLYYDFYTL